jgi:acetone carboxylase gamma subunit
MSDVGLTCCECNHCLTLYRKNWRCLKCKPVEIGY